MISKIQERSVVKKNTKNCLTYAKSFPIIDIFIISFLRSVIRQQFFSVLFFNMYEQEFKYVFRLFTFVGMHPMKKMIKPLVIFNFVLTLYVTILILLRLLLNTDLLVVESVGVFSQVQYLILYNYTV